MNTLVMEHSAGTPTTARDIGPHGRVFVLLAMAGGVGLGGLLVGLMTLAGRLSGHGVFQTATALFLVGAMLGMVHGAPLAILGRPANVTRREALHDLAVGAMYMVPGLAVSWLAAVWCAMSVVAAYSGKLPAMVGVGLGWLGCGIIVASAGLSAIRALRRAYARWPERRLGTALTAASWAALLALFLADRPEIWGLRLRVTEVGAVLLATALSVWVAGPLVTVALRAARRLPWAGHRDHGRLAVDLGTGLLVGAVVGLLAVPFAGPHLAAGVMGTAVHATAQALLNNIVLRVVVISLASWALLRWERLSVNEAGVGAILLGAVVQIAVYVPGMVSVGFPTPAGVVGALLAVAAIPALAFGAVFWKRGLRPALVAEVVAMLTLLMLPM